MIEAFVLIKTEPGTTTDVLAGVRKVKGVKRVEPVTGPYDIIAEVEAEDVNALAGVVVNKIRKVKGISDTLTCIKVSL